MNAIQEINPFRVWVAEKYFHDLENVEENTYKRCAVFAVVSYQGRQPTFMVRVMGVGAVFADIPVEALYQNRHQESPVPAADLCHYNCPDCDIQINRYRYLEGGVLCYIGERRLRGTYYLTVDWPFANQNMHLISLETGQMAWVANHKVLFRPDDQSGLPKYKKLTQEWRTTSEHSSHRIHKKIP